MFKIWKMIPNKKKLIPYVILFTSFYLILFFLFKYFNINRERIEEFIGPFGALGILVVFILQLIFSMTPLPDSSLTVISVLLFGPLQGTVTIFLAMFIASIFHYLIAKHYGKAYILKKFPQSAGIMEEMSKEVTISKLIIYRMFLVITFDLTAYIAGVSDISFKNFCIAAIFGIFPIVMTSALIGIGLFAENGIEVFVIWISYIALIIAYAVLSKRAKLKVS